MWMYEENRATKKKNIDNVWGRFEGTSIWSACSESHNTNKREISQTIIRDIGGWKYITVMEGIWYRSKADAQLIWHSYN